MTGSQARQPDLSFCRNQFPALEKKVAGKPVVFLDGPGGTQVPRRVIDRVSRYLAGENANTHGAFPTSRATDEALAGARQAMADLLGAQPGEIAFGQNMTTLNFALSRALGRHLGEGDEIVITDLDHEANRGPWMALAEKGITVKSARVDTAARTIDLDDLRARITPRTRVVAVSGASNAVGTTTDVRQVSAWAHDGGALCVVDAVHLAPHKPIDVRDLGCDFLLCSAYKFFGPHVGVIYGRREAFEDLEAYKLVPQDDAVPFRIETGTLNHEGVAGVTEAVGFIADLGRKVSPAVGEAGDQRAAILAGMTAIDAYESELAEWFAGELRRIDGLVIYGPPEGYPRTPTLSIRLRDLNPEGLSARLAEAGVFAWAGDFYATTLVRRLGLASSGGLLRMGLAPYNTREELERVFELLKRM